MGPSSVGIVYLGGNGMEEKEKEKKRIKNSKETAASRLWLMPIAQTTSSSCSNRVATPIDHVEFLPLIHLNRSVSIIF